MRDVQIDPEIDGHYESPLSFHRNTVMESAKVRVVGGIT